MNNKMIFLIIGITAVIAFLLKRAKLKYETSAMLLGQNFSLWELIRTNTGLPNDPNSEQLANLRHLVASILQPLRDELGKPVNVTSGFRSNIVNVAVGGSATSQHKEGLAADINVSGMSNAQIIDKVRELRLPYDQLIDEQIDGKNWVHVSTTGNPRRQLMTARRNAETGKIEYTLISLT